MHITVYSPTFGEYCIPIDWIFTNTFYDCLKNYIHVVSLRYCTVCVSLFSTIIQNLIHTVNPIGFI
jgi:hypothetical protein